MTFSWNLNNIANVADNVIIDLKIKKKKIYRHS